MRCKPWHAELLADRRAIVYFAILNIRATERRFT
jgi:hypothetical protein